MPEETPKDSPSADAGVVGTAPQADGGSQEFVSRTELNAAVDRIIQEIAVQSKANRQSQSDVIKARVEKEIGAKLASALRPDASPEPAPAPSAPPKAVEPAQPSAAVGVEAEIQAILTDHKLTGTEPELVAYLTENKGKPWYAVGGGFAAVAQTLGARAGGTVLAGEGSQSASPNDTEAYITAVRGIREAVIKGMDRNTSRAELTKLKDKFRKKGVKVDQIGFGSVGSRTNS